MRSSPQIFYLVLGCQNSGRRRVLFDIAKDLAAEPDPFTILISESETPNDWQVKFSELDNVTLEMFSGETNSIQTDHLNSSHTNVVILAPGLANPIDQVEALKTLIQQVNCDLGRILTVAHCDQLQAHNQLFSWYDACIHFSDVCLINRGAETTNQFVQNFINRYKKQHFPCLFETTRKGSIKNPGLILEPQARRISLYFEPEEDRWLDKEEDWDENSHLDPYLKRLPSGSRAKWIPDIQAILIP